MRPSPFQRHLDALVSCEAPLPLTPKEAVQQAYRLKSAGLSYESISTVMRSYHGWSKSAMTWRKHCRAAGIGAGPMRGVPVNISLRRTG